MKTMKILMGLAVLALGAQAQAALNPFVSFTGNVGLSTDGWGSTSQSGVISASVPAGSTVIAAYLYSATFNSSATAPTVTLGGTGVTFGPQVPNATACCSLASWRSDVTSIVKPTIDGGAGGVYNFAVTEGQSNIDGEALVVVYQNAALPEATVGILDGFASVTGDTASINFADPLDPSDPGFFAEMALGIGFSCCSQKSSVAVNGTTITLNAGNNDDGNVVGNGSLITVGSFDDPLSPFMPTYEQDHERYDLSGQVALGDTSITVTTSNPSRDDNIFLAAFHVSGIAGINEPPPDPDPEPSPLTEPGTLGLLGAGVLLMAIRRRRMQ